jgi:two-component system phosphate regulon sensor histidine kinase PhoR
VPRIQLKFLALLAAPVAVVAFASGLLAERALRLREIERIERSLGEHVEIVRVLTAGVPFTRERSAELSALARRAAAAAGARVTLIATDGTVVADSEVPVERLGDVENHGERSEVAAALQGERSITRRTSATVGRPLLYEAAPAAGGPGAGVVRLAVDLSQIDAAAWELRRTLAVASVIGLVAALGLSVWFSWLSLRPIQRFREVIASLARGDVDRRIDWPSRDELGDIARAVNSMGDQLRSRLDEVIEEKEQLTAVLSAMVEGVLVLDRGGRVLLANPRFRELFEVRGEVAGRAPIEVVRHPDVEAAIREAIATRDPVVRELALRAPGDHAIRLHAVAFPAAGPVLGAVVVFHDMTAIRRLENVRRDFVANVSHELRTPLTAIRGFAETLRAEHLTPEKRRGYLEVILRHSERLGELIDDILTLSRIESGQMRLTPETLDVARLASTVLRGMEPLLRSKSLAALVDGEGAPLAFADRQAVEQVLTNLLDNAVKYTPEGGHVAVRLRGEGAKLRVEVQDDGVGIAREHLPRLFERFYRVDPARSRELGGTGLGLAIVKHLVQIQGGEISARSEPGRGSTFAFTLPTRFPRTS